jgi:hypothetical protein
MTIITVLDLHKGKIKIYKIRRVKKLTNEECETFLRNNGYNLDEVNYMITSKARIDILETESDLTSWDVDATIWMS